MSQTGAPHTRTMLGMAEHVSRPRLLCKALPTTPNPSQRIGLAPLRAVATISPPSPRALTTVEHVEAQHPEFLHVDDLDSEMAAAFAQYQRATSAIATAAERSSQLEAMLGDIDKLQAELDESLLELPPPVVDKAQRAAKRAAKRAERKATQPSSSAGHAASAPFTSASFADAAQLKDSRHALEELFQVSMPEASTSAPLSANRAPVLKPKLAPKGRAAIKPKLTVASVAAADISAPVAGILTPPSPVAPSASPSPLPAQGAAVQQPTQPLAFEDDEEEDDGDFDGPSASDLAALERDLQGSGALNVELHEDDMDGAGVHASSSSSFSSSSSSSVLDASALVLRGPEQTSLMPAGPSLMGLAAASATAARSRHSRRAAVYSRSGASLAAKSQEAAKRINSKVATDGTTNLMKASGLLGDSETDVTRVAQDFLFLERVRRQVTRTLRREPTRVELAAAVSMDAKAFMMRYTIGQRAQSQVLRGNYRLVLSICKKYLSRGAVLQDLVSEGIKGLMRAVEKFDPARGFRFSTYSHWWIRQAITRSLAETGRTVRLPIHIVEQISKINSVREELTEALERDPTTDEVAARAGMSAKRIEMLMRTARTTASLDSTIGSEDGGQTYKDLVEDERSTADEELVRNQLESDINDVLGELKEREALVMRLRFGLHDGSEWTLEQIGNHLKVTRERVRQIETKALRKLRARQQLLAGKLHEYSSGMELMEEHSYAARTSSGTKKT